MPVFDEHLLIFHVYNKVSGTLLHKIHNNIIINFLFIINFCALLFFMNIMVMNKWT